MTASPPKFPKPECISKDQLMLNAASRLTGWGSWVWRYRDRHQPLGYPATNTLHPSWSPGNGSDDVMPDMPDHVEEIDAIVQQMPSQARHICMVSWVYAADETKDFQSMVFGQRTGTKIMTRQQWSERQKQTIAWVAGALAAIKLNKQPHYVANFRKRGQPIGN